MINILTSKIMTKGYGVQVTTIEGQNDFCSSAVLCVNFHMTDGQNTRDQICTIRFQVIDQVQMHMIKLPSVHSIHS